MTGTSDALIYKAGFAADSRGGNVSHSLYNAKLIITMLKEKFQPATTEIYLTSTDPLKNFRSIINPLYKKNRVKRCPQCKHNCDACVYKNDPTVVAAHSCQKLTEMLYLQTDDKGLIFRAFECMTCHKDRIRDTKPVYYKELRQYLCTQFNAKICLWGEADDWLGSNYTENTIIASHDKDLLMIPCSHWRLHREVFVEASDPGMLELVEHSNPSGKTKTLEGYGFKFFCAQMLSGDVVDNIKKPVKKFGPVKIYDYLNKYDTIIDQWNAVIRFYEQHNLTTEDLILAGKQLWIARKKRQEFSLELIEELI